MLLSRCFARWVLAAGTGLVMQAGMAAPAQVSLVLVQPAQFTDAGYSRRTATAAELERLQQALQGALQPLAAERLPAGDQLQVEVLDVDLAGELQMMRWPTGSELRVMREITWPRITLRWRLLHEGREVSRGEQRLSDLNYLAGRPPGSDSDRYDPERRLLQRWFQQTFGAGPAAP